jgi:hypothetical protein
MTRTEKRIETLNIKRIKAMDKHMQELTEKIKDYNKPERIEKRKVIEKQLHAIGRYFNLN